MLRPIGTLSMIRLMLHGAMGTLGEAQSVERFEFDHMVVRPTLAPGRRGVKVAFDGEVTTDARAARLPRARQALVPADAAPS